MYDESEFYVGSGCSLYVCEDGATAKNPRTGKVVITYKQDR
jgi:hypothetical protein